ncbi:Hydrolase of the alpha/beta superfamily [Collimonas arenae]|uniref:Hydrolase of the alpha/beta superfamily n=1 Tax=Collimonas arenae TaxID=279058 RepID=A0A0A1FCQ7_9BURK|nr:alpha/beta hydrolase [Collimonas arenae]AIY42246.1 Hydrolase of the alpha/beta superfamily [Collimonas arenae]
MRSTKAKIPVILKRSSIVLAWLFTVASAQAAAPSAQACLTGAYRSQAGQVVTLTQRPGEPKTLLATNFDGRSGVFEMAGDDTFRAAVDADNPAKLAGRLTYAGCQADSVDFQFAGDVERPWKRLPLRITHTRFMSGAVQLNGELIEPLDAGDRPPLFVLVHGSESTATVDSSNHAFLMASQGVAAFLFDKRGTGASGGVYTQDFELLADDVAAAVGEARKLSAGRVGRIGVAGFSQGGWVAPLAAAKAQVDFLVVGYGVIGTPIEQDQWQVDYQLRELGYGEDIVGKARTLTDLAGSVAASNFNSGMPELLKAARKYEGQPWLAKVDGQYSGELLRGEVEQARRESPQVIWHYDSLAVLRQLAIPQLWVFAQDDSVAPSAPTIARLNAFRGSGKDIAIAVFPQSDHGIRAFSVRADGSRKYTSYAAGYDQLLADWMKQKPLSPEVQDKMLGPAAKL